MGVSQLDLFLASGSYFRNNDEKIPKRLMNLHRLMVEY